ncbi:PLP-dependent aminotransferase family protein [Umezawaea beigongshangensis]|uniref:aminotransferase-like domain-containing protein n=1 Tax=Umezawaea beigongshangensis TaxID=2780383 RepID=UPI0027DCED72|nr:PLP-dependent aminotransferase family protein [Umezawaea beigongshangensis]
MNISSKISRRAAALGRDRIADVHEQLSERPEVVSFAVGAPDVDLLPVDLVSLFTERALTRWGSSVLQYGSTRGFQPLLAAVQPLLAARGVHAGPERTHISTGGSGALNSVAAALIDPGDVVLVERPTYAPAVSVFRSHGATVVAVDTDEQGVVPAALDTGLTLHRDALTYLLPTFQNPTGRTASADRRREVAEVLRRHDALAVEDDVYWDLRYRGEPVAALASHAPEHVVYLTSLSKTLAPALRVGITTMPPLLLEAVLRLKQGIDMQTSALAQAVATEALGSPEFETHLTHVVDVYGTKTALLQTALRAHLPDGFRWSDPDGGLFTWVEGPDDFDADELLPRALDAGVAFLPGSVFHTADGAGRNSMRLSIAGAAVADVERGAGTLASLCGAGRRG